MGTKFQYDENGGTFFYFLLSFLALILIPVTFYYWPRRKKRDPEEEIKRCHCPPCLAKRNYMKNTETWKGPKTVIIKLLIIGGWAILILLAYRVSQFDYEMANFDPYEILGVSIDASQAEIKKAYRKLSLILHPDKDTGNEQEFMKLSKAYQALTDEESRKNWEKYGSPDGPSAMSFGIALPSWIVEKENSVWVLGLYALVFMVALPIVVGTWWYRSIKFTGEQVLLETTKLYYYFFHKHPKMLLKKVIMVLAASLEFDREHNSEIKIRQSDNQAVPQLIKEIESKDGTAIDLKNKDRPLCYPYSIKARALIYAHLHRIPLDPDTLEIDKRYIIEKCPYLILEQVNCVHQLFIFAYARRDKNSLPNIETIENCMKLCPMIVQALPDMKSPLLQLPHFTEATLKHFHTKKKPIKTLQQYAQLRGEERRALLRSFSDEQYADVMKVLGQMPYVSFEVNYEVLDDENPTEVTQGAIVTVTVSLKRRDMSTIFGDDSAKEDTISENGIVAENDETKEGSEPPADPAEKRPMWLKSKKTGGKKPKKTNKQVKPLPTVQIKGNVEDSPKPTSNSTELKLLKEKNRETTKDEGVETDESDDSDAAVNDKSSGDETVAADRGDGAHNEDDDQEWEKFQRIHEKQKALEARSKTSHSAHCPLFPCEKQEYWWTYVCDRKSRTLLTPPQHVTSLVDREIVVLKFTAPLMVRMFTFTVCLRSDAYIGFDQQKDIKLDVKKAPAEITKHPQWEFEDSEEEGPAVDAGNESEYTTDEDCDDEDDD